MLLVSKGRLASRLANSEGMERGGGCQVVILIFEYLYRRCSHSVLNERDALTHFFQPQE